MRERKTIFQGAADNHRCHRVGAGRALVAQLVL